MRSLIKQRFHWAVAVLLRQDWVLLRELLENIAPENQTDEVAGWQEAATAAKRPQGVAKPANIYSALMSENLPGEPKGDEAPDGSGETDLEDKLADAFKQLRDED